jgi:hypothetical protein
MNTLDSRSGNVPRRTAERLRQRENQARARLTAASAQLQTLEQRKGLSATERAARQDAILAERRAAQRDWISAAIDVQLASPQYYLVTGRNQSSLSLKVLQSALARTNALLSACDTNAGPQQRGEGAWALSRGFLVAGSRRVVASNWLVDDEAAPNFVSCFTSIIAKAEHDGKTPDYAQAVHNAKLFLRHHPNKNWHNPYYWGTFVLIGPN